MFDQVTYRKIFGGTKMKDMPTMSQEYQVRSRPHLFTVSGNRELRLGRDWWRRADGPEPSQMATEGRFLACERESTSQKVVMAPITQGIPPSYYPPNEDDNEDGDD